MGQLPGLTGLFQETIRDWTYDGLPRQGYALAADARLLDDFASASASRATPA
ncbi:MAG: hypothetical protein JO159_18305 [Acidobacteria bacterium]|nr:hypothetical protein [Acidobacteriota bacterium]